MWEARTLHRVEPLRLSIQGIRQHLDNFIPQLAFASNQKRVQLDKVVHKLLPESPRRSKYCVRERRLTYLLMMKPRQILRQEVLPLTLFVRTF